MPGVRNLSRADGARDVDERAVTRLAAQPTERANEALTGDVFDSARREQRAQRRVPRAGFKPVDVHRARERRHRRVRLGA